MGLRERLKLGKAVRFPPEELVPTDKTLSPSRPSDRARATYHTRTKSLDNNPNASSPQILYRHKSARTPRSIDVEHRRRSHSLWSPTPLLGSAAAQYRLESTPKETTKGGGSSTAMSLEDICRLSSVGGSDTPDSSLSPQRIFSSLISIENQ